MSKDILRQLTEREAATVTRAVGGLMKQIVERVDPFQGDWEMETLFRDTFGQQ